MEIAGMVSSSCTENRTVTEARDTEPAAEQVKCKNFQVVYRKLNVQ